MKILVTFAVEAEFAPWAALRTFKKVRLCEEHWSGGVEVYEAAIGDSTVWVLLTGMGNRSVSFEKIICFKMAGVEAFLSSGLAGALNADLKLGQVIIPRRVGNLRDAIGLAAAEKLLVLAEQTEAKIVATLITADHIVETSEEKKRLSFFGDAVDMESFRLVSEFAMEGVPAAVIRAISDVADEDLPIDFSICVTDSGKVKPMAMLGQIFKRPQKVPALIRFGVQSKKSAQTLALFLDAFVQNVKPEIFAHDATQAATQ